MVTKKWRSTLGAYITFVREVGSLSRCTVKLQPSARDLPINVTRDLIYRAYKANLDIPMIIIRSLNLTIQFYDLRNSFAIDLIVTRSRVLIKSYPLIPMGFR